MSQNTYHVFCDCADCVMRDMVYVRLKERVKELENKSCEPYAELHYELQKILEGKK